MKAYKGLHLKSYFATSIDEALELGERELGENALLVDTRPAPPEAMHLGRYEVVLAVAPEGELEADEIPTVSPVAEPNPVRSAWDKPASEIPRGPFPERSRKRQRRSSPVMRALSAIGALPRALWRTLQSLRLRTPQIAEVAATPLVSEAPFEAAESVGPQVALETVEVVKALAENDVAVPGPVEVLTNAFEPEAEIVHARDFRGRPRHAYRPSLAMPAPIRTSCARRSPRPVRTRLMTSTQELSKTCRLKWTA